MRNIETRSNKIGQDDAGLNQILTEARMEEPPCTRCGNGCPP